MLRARLLVVFVALDSFALAVAENQPGQADKTPANGTKSDYASTEVLSRNQVYRVLPARPGWRVPVWDPNLQATCFKLRTYVVRRDGPKSDVLHPAGYTTCQPAPRFEVKVTEQREQDEGKRDNLKASW